MALHTPVPPSVAGHINVLRDLTPRYWKQVSDMTVRNFLTYFNMRKWGSLTFNGGSHTQVWNARVKQPTVLPAIANQPLNFDNQDTDIQYYIGNKGYRATDYYPQEEFLMARNAPEMVNNRYEQKGRDLAQAMVEAVSSAFWKDGNVAANINDFTGILTPLSYDASTCFIGDKVGLPNGTYAGQSMALGNLGGYWTSGLATKPNASLGKDWPFGQGSSEYDGTSPLIVNYGSSAWGTSSALWKDNAVAATSFAQVAMLHRGGQSLVGAPPQCVMASEMFVDMKDSFRVNNRQVMPYRDGDLGFPGETLLVDGMVYSMDYAIPASNAFLYLPQYVESYFLHEDIYGAMGPEYSMERSGYLYYTYSFGNNKFSPKYLARFISDTTP